ncbi:hypothetical protein N9W84_01425 [bacterium]|nr:hypothetical protein [bacterium]
MAIPSDVLSELYIDNKFLFSFIQRKLSHLLIRSSVTKKNIAHMRRSERDIDIIYFNSEGIYATEKFEKGDLNLPSKIEEVIDGFIVDAELAICLDEALDEEKRMEMALNSFQEEIEDCVN